MILELRESHRPYFNVPDDFLDNEIKDAYRRLEGARRRIQTLENEKGVRFIERATLQKQE